MKGTSHAIVGAATGFVVANYYQATPATTILLVGLGGISGLMPDMDIDGTLRNRITISHKVFRTVTQIIGILMILYSFLNGTSQEQIYGAAIGASILLLSLFIKKKHMLTITGAAVLVGGISLQENWLLLLGIFIIISSLIAHRSYTHSIIGILFYSIISLQFEQSTQIEGAYYTCLLAYISHIICDSRFLPVNKRGVKLFLPFSSKDL
ncbi:metal-dependent hydrolase [Niallia nealsonii]|uniref:Metal-dependent hydrolase n=1 Tax=Niallia nealsonii TaxID=115979 RepID=A0A2N0Z7C7_9BACI|nr:metal-dependent hydrolase [Niallia nealsonii]PKG25425.1 metal-dependent hydrolase [Niallia nealsonii]